MKSDFFAPLKQYQKIRLYLQWIQQRNSKRCVMIATAKFMRPVHNGTYHAAVEQFMQAP